MRWVSPVLYLLVLFHIVFPQAASGAEGNILPMTELQIDIMVDSELAKDSDGLSSETIVAEFCDTWTTIFKPGNGPWGFGLSENVKCGQHGVESGPADPFNWLFLVQASGPETITASICRTKVSAAGSEQICEAKKELQRNQFSLQILADEDFAKLLLASLLDQIPIVSRLHAKLLPSDQDSITPVVEKSIPSLSGRFSPVYIDYDTSSGIFMVDVATVSALREGVSNRTPWVVNIEGRNINVPNILPVLHEKYVQITAEFELLEEQKRQQEKLHQQMLLAMPAVDANLGLSLSMNNAKTQLLLFGKAFWNANLMWSFGGMMSVHEAEYSNAVNLNAPNETQTAEASVKASSRFVAALSAMRPWKYEYPNVRLWLGLGVGNVALQFAGNDLVSYVGEASSATLVPAVSYGIDWETDSFITRIKLSAGGVSAVGGDSHQEYFGSGAFQVFSFSGSLAPLSLDAIARFLSVSDNVQVSGVTGQVRMAYSGVYLGLGMQWLR